MNIISHRKHVECVSYQLSFDWEGGSPGHGFGFPCDEKGHVHLHELAGPARANLAKCLFGEHKVIFRGIQENHYTYTQPAVGRCECGCEVTLDSFTNTCDRCFADYNMSGQKLAPRSQWGEETGEHWSDCL